MNILLITLFVGAVSATFISAVRKEREQQKVQLRINQQRNSFLK